MKKVIFGVIVLFTLICSSACENEPEIDPIVGEWQLYRSETVETVLLEWDVDNGTWITGEEWQAITWDDLPSFHVFHEDGTFDFLYADVLVYNGIWGQSEDGRYYIEYIFEEGIENNNLPGTIYMDLLCENTHSQEIGGENPRIEYHRKRNTTECADMIDYNAE